MISLATGHMEWAVNDLDRHRQEAAFLSHLIITWHRHVGTRLGRERMSSSPEAYHGYVRLLERFLGADLSDPSVQIEIARQQLSGTFEWFYGEEIPPEILRQASAHHELQFDIPRRLNEVAKRILAINENMPTRPEDSPEAQGRTVVRFSDHGDLLSKARQVYRHLTNEEEAGIGGANFLLALFHRTPEVARTPVSIGRKQ
jgi:hypothetical protein